MGKSPEQINGRQAMASSRLVDELTYNGAGGYPAMINSRGIEMGLQPMAPYYPTGKLSPAENPRARQHANDSSNLTLRSHVHSQVLILDNRPQKCL